jgi:PAS domain S-box-containing protein
MFTDYNKYKQILEAMSDGIYIVDRNLIVLYTNPTIQNMLKDFEVPSELIGAKFTEVFPVMSGYFPNEIETVWVSRKPLRVEHTVQVGVHLVDYESVRIPMLSDTGEVIAVINTIHDVTGYKSIQKELEKSRSLFETMVDNANSVILRMDMVGRVTYFNRFAEQFFGFMRKEIIGKSVQETIIPPRDSGGRNLTGLIRDIVENPAKYSSNENENCRKDGTRVWLSWSNKPIYDALGKVTEILCVGNDITALKKAQQDLVDYQEVLEEKVAARTKELKESEEQYRFLFEEGPSLSIVIAHDATIVDVNNAMARNLGYGRVELIGRNSLDFFVPEQKREAEEFIKRRISGETIVNCENRVRARDGSLRINLTMGQREIRKNGIVIGTLLCGMDITEQKKLEEIKRLQQEDLVRTDKLTSLGVLVSGVAHEINNPNNFIILNSDNLVDIWKEMRSLLDDVSRERPDLRIVGLPYAEIREEMEHLLGGIRQGARRIRTIVQNLKDFARQGPVDMEQSVDIAAVIEASCTIVANLIKKSTAHFKIKSNPGLPKVKGDFQKLEQVVINLLSNACQALTDRVQAITVSAGEDRETGAIRIIVRDEGKGIAHDVLPFIFDPFFTTKRESGGTGLGLAISYGIIKDHKGTLEARSEPGNGSQFTITLPSMEKAV